MVINEKACPNCGGGLMHYDTVSRKCVMKDRNVSVVKIRRMRCKKCKKLHREIPPYIFPFKHYETEIVLGVVEGLITSDTLGYEDYPCEVNNHCYTHLII